MFCLVTFHPVDYVNRTARAGSLYSLFCNHLPHKNGVNEQFSFRDFKYWDCVDWIRYTPKKAKSLLGRLMFGLDFHLFENLSDFYRHRYQKPVVYILFPRCYSGKKKFQLIYRSMHRHTTQYFRTIVRSCRNCCCMMFSLY